MAVLILGGCRDYIKTLKSKLLSAYNNSSYYIFANINSLGFFSTAIPIILLGYAENIRSQKIVIENKQAKYISNYKTVLINEIESIKITKLTNSVKIYGTGNQCIKLENCKNINEISNKDLSIFIS